MQTVFFAIDDEPTRRALRLALALEGHTVVSSLQEGPDIAIVDEKGLALIEEASNIPTLVFTIGGMEGFVGTLRRKLTPSLNHGGESAFAA